MLIRNGTSAGRNPQLARGWAMLALMATACTPAPGSTDPATAQVWVSGRSHNRSAVDVYLLCGDRDARLLGAIIGKGSNAFEIPHGSLRCLRGLNFFVVVQDQDRGYWVGPVRPGAGGYVELVVEKYAGLSSARVLGRDAAGW
jgi:hypothetical protein